MSEPSDLPPQSLTEQLKASYLANAEESRKIAEEWLPLEVEARLVVVNLASVADLNNQDNKKIVT